MAMTIWDCSRRIVFERGVEFARNGNWHCESIESGTSSPDMTEFATRHGISPVMVELDHSSTEPLLILLPNTQDRKTLDIAIQDLWTKHDLAKAPFADVLSIAYTASALVYHTKRMAGEYSRIVRRWLSRPFPPTETDKVVFGHQPEPFFEFDALVAAGVELWM